MHNLDLWTHKDPHKWSKECLLYKGLLQMRAPLAARREPAENQNKPPNVLYVYEHKT